MRNFVSFVQGSTRHIPLPPKSVSCVVTSPPYFNLRSYLPASDPLKSQEIGSEPTIADYLRSTIEWASEIYRVLRDDGTFWLNVGDSYNGSGGAGGDYNEGGLREGQPKYGRHFDPILGPKDMCLIPQRVALALQDAGWYVRNEIIWFRTNAMPTSAQDRLTYAHESIWLLTKAPHYYFDAFDLLEETSSGGGKRQMRDVWGVPSVGLPSKDYGQFGEHYATFPVEIPMRCIKGGTSGMGVCSKCGAPYKRVIERTASEYNPKAAQQRVAATGGAITGGTRKSTLGKTRGVVKKTVGWEPTCSCRFSDVVPATVLDPFVGSGSTMVAAALLGRSAVGVDLTPKYAELAFARLKKEAHYERYQ